MAKNYITTEKCRKLEKVGIAVSSGGWRKKLLWNEIYQLFYFLYTLWNDKISRSSYVCNVDGFQTVIVNVSGKDVW